MQTILASTKEFELEVSFSNTDISLIQECVTLATEHPGLSAYWNDAIALTIIMMDAQQHTLFRFNRLYTNAIEMAIFGGSVENPIIVHNDYKA